MSERKEISIYDLGSGAIGILEKELADLRAALDVAMHESDQWREQAQQMRAELDAARGVIAALLKWTPLPQYAINQEMSDAITTARAWLDAAVKGDER